MKQKTTAIQKIALILFSILLTCLTLEAILRIGGFILTKRQDSSNKISFDSDEFRILCLGESTTALGGSNSYPDQLNEVLSERNTKIKFTVINKGRTSKTSEDILAYLKNDLENYNPHLVITMIGINEGRYQAARVNLTPLKVHSALKSFRVYKLFNLIYFHFTQKIKEVRRIKKADQKTDHFNQDEAELSKDKVDDIDEKIVKSQIAKIQLISDSLLKRMRQTKHPTAIKQERQQLKLLKVREGMLYLALGRYYRSRKDYNEAEISFKKILENDPNNFGAHIEFGRCFKDQEKYTQAMYFFKTAIRIDQKSAISFVELGRCYSALGRLDDTLKMYKAALDREITDLWIYPEIAQWFKEHGHYKQAEKIYLKIIDINPKDFSLYDNLSEVYKLQGKNQEASKFARKASLDEERAERYLPSTISNYNAIADNIKSRGIGIICMQYPLRSIESLREMLWPKKNIIFVENKENFEEALKGAEYSKYFSDNFAGNFGHCTRAGNRLIAENLADTILKEFF